ncbi:hypothetical protein OK18_15840 [Chryseobacterium gallinarum]|uniref:Alpha/beta hydrolase fold-3 domain-containing protein n=1 Tax=Chryseobacterium gallinarum TaxID=1324352 RepID=A0A0G3M4R5_CHRGL|nr:alpha/beta hydrolase fold domain-containing protein [Chryseobacterium gallinarum]AKK73884.1 hypothetical protein OK18_15840 [Chryseobacterium gallinarum]
MQKNILLFVLSLFLLSCTSGKVVKNTENNNHYEVTRSDNQKAVLVLFPCFPCDIEHTKAEAGFLKSIEKEGVTTILLDYNQKLFLKESEKKEYAAVLNSIFDQHHIDKANVFIGGFSSGGNVALLLSSFLIKNENAIQPKGLLVVDSPVDLEQLYHNAEKDVAANVDPDAVEEGKFLIGLFDQELGKPDENPATYKTASPYLMTSNSVENIQYLKNIKTRFYCEPDLDWQQQNKGRKFEDLNAFVLKKANEALVNLGNHTAEYIETKNRGIRANGKKHPHSWNIVEQKGLVKWMLE